MNRPSRPTDAMTLDAHPLVHPELRAGVAALRARDPATPGGRDHVVTPDELALLLPALRATWTVDGSHVPAVVKAVPVARRVVPGPAGAPDVPVYLVGAPSAEPCPAILHMHGGGFIAGRAVEFVPVPQA